MSDDPPDPEKVGDEGRPPSNSAYHALARRFRPQTFAEVVGQAQVVQTISGFLRQGRVPHAFLFSGSRGVGKTTSARILARAVNCENLQDIEPCGACPSCLDSLEGRSVDIFELDAASNNSVEDVRALREQASFAPLKGKKRVFILDEVHMFSKAAFNALLKILEEPPDHVVFILATTELHKVPDTVRSRCSVLPFRRIGESAIQERLAQICAREGKEIAPEVLAEIAASCMGGLRDAETALERILPLAEELDLEGFRRLEGRLGFQRALGLIGDCLEGDVGAALRYAQEASEIGAEERECLGEILSVCRFLFCIVADGEETLLIEAEGEWRDRLVSVANKTSLAYLDGMMQCLILARDRMRRFDDRRVLLELTLTRLARLGETRSLQELLEQAPAPSRAPTVRPAEPTPFPPTSSSRPDSRGPVDPRTAAPAQKPSPPSAGKAKEEPAPQAPPTPTDPWLQALEWVGKKKPLLRTLLVRGKPIWEKQAALRVELRPTGRLDRQLLQREDSARLLQAALREVMKRDVEVRFVLLDEANPPPPSTDSPAPKKPPSDEGLPELGREIKKTFGANLVDRRLEEPGA
ncbi:MAG TPA: DNA polymerase III subunit gamma/tau [Planctomycetes bacterium]|nr:DNA polymerase III subunit gamma/tau [Planctomycetota bacterium]